MRLRNSLSYLKTALAQVSAPKTGFSGVKVLTLSGSTGGDLRRAGGQIRCCLPYLVLGPSAVVDRGST